jgi:hypothetical protein
MTSSNRLTGYFTLYQSCPTSTRENCDSQRYAYEFHFDRNGKDASISNSSTGMRMALPRQDRRVDGFVLHEYCEFTPALSSYLRYLETHHILLFTDAPEVLHIHDKEEPEPSEDDWDNEGSISYHTLLFRMSTGTRTLPYFGFSFIDDKLYSSINLRIVERG